MKRYTNWLLVALALLTPSLAQAHSTGFAHSHGFASGAGHPLSGLDHLCAMIAVGLWAAQLGGRALWAVPLTFVSVMALGGALGMAGMQIPFVEQGIVISVLTLGVLIAASARLPLAASTALVGLFAICHGFAHGAEMPETASGLLYAGGFIVSTAILHMLGIGIGMVTQRVAQPQMVRFAGLTITACGAYLWLS